MCTGKIRAFGGRKDLATRIRYDFSVLEIRDQRGVVRVEQACSTDQSQGQHMLVVGCANFPLPEFGSPVFHLSVDR